MLIFLVLSMLLGLPAVAQAPQGAWVVQHPETLTVAFPATAWLPVPAPPVAHIDGGELLLDVANADVVEVPFRTMERLEIRLRVFRGAGRPTAGAVPVVQSNMSIQPFRNGEPSWWSSADEPLFRLEPTSLPIYEMEAVRRDGFWVVYDVSPEGQAHDPLLFRAWAYPGDGPVWCGDQP